MTISSIKSDIKEAVEIKTTNNMVPKAEAMQYASDNNIKSMRAWFAFHNLRNGGSFRPQNIPGDPSKFYGKTGEWQGWPEFLGTEQKPTKTLTAEFVDLESCKEWFLANKISSVLMFRTFCKVKQRPSSIPAAPDKVYGVKFSELLAPKKERYLSFEKSKEKIAPMGFQNYLEFRQGRRDNMDILHDVPCNPDNIYSDSWVNWADFLGK